MSDIVTSNNIERTFQCYEHFLKKAVATGDLEYFAAARATAIWIIDYEKRMSAFRFSHILMKIYKDLE